MSVARVVYVALACVLVASLVPGVQPVPRQRVAAAATPIECDIIVAGGSTAALAVAVTAAERAQAVAVRRGRDGRGSASTPATVCLTDPTEWPGGQLTASGVPAIDFGPYNRLTANQPPSFVSLLASTGAGNPGQCWVSTKCFLPGHLVSGWILPRIKNLTNLHLFARTTVVGVDADNVTGAVTAIHGVQRAPVEAHTARRGSRATPPSALPWGQWVSAELPDWYSPNNSVAFTKQRLTFTGPASRLPVVVDATEYGDVLALGRLPYTQGVEVPTENSLVTESGCGQETVFPFYVRALSANNATAQPPPVVLPQTADPPFSLDNNTWYSVWTYRRVFVPNETATNASDAQVRPHPRPESQSHVRDASWVPPPGEISNQDWGFGNDYGSGYLFLDDAHTRAQLDEGLWAGGVNLTTVRGAELRAYQWFESFTNRSRALELARDVSGTATGLAMLPYVRDTRRSVGIGGFRLTYAAMVGNAPTDGSTPVARQHQRQRQKQQSSVATGYRFHDTVAIGDYLYADTHRLSAGVCTYPSYMDAMAMRPYYIPYRALTNSAAPNVLVAGKTMAQTFHANSATRLQPVEWASGVAAGAAAALLVRLAGSSPSQRLPSTAYLLDAAVLPTLLAEAAAVGPVEWTFPA